MPESPAGLRGFVGLCLFMGCASAMGHEVRIYTSVHGQTVSGRVYYEGGPAAVGARLQLVDASGRVADEATANRDGRFSLKADRADDFDVTVQTADLHEARVHIDAGEWNVASTDQPTENDEAGPGLVIEEVRALREQVDRLESTIWLRDILGGMGILLGVFGLWAMIRRGKST